MTVAPPDGAELEVQIVRLQRRLERERVARAEAEAIAEAGIRKLYDQAQRLQLLETVASETNLEASVDKVFFGTLRRICEFTHWPLGHALIRTEEPNGPAMISTRQWFARSGLAFEPFRDASQGTVFSSGSGLPGRVLESACSICTVDLSAETNFPRSAMARACGLNAAFAFPVLIGSEVAAVLEFYLDYEFSPDEELLQTLDRIGSMLGRAIERDRAERLAQQATAELQRAVAEAQAASAAKTRFLAVTSHEVRTPLNAVLGLAEVLSRTALSEGQIEFVDGIRESGSMLLRLLNAVLDIAKIETGRVVLTEAPFDLRLMAEAITRLWRGKARESGVSIDLDMSGLAEVCRLVSDGGKIEQTLVNLVSNAIKFTRTGGRILLRLSSHDLDEGRRVLIEVLDEGPGVPEQDRHRIFEAYEQTGVGREAGGAGLGLAICMGNARALGGVIAVDARPEGGSRFWFEFDAACAEAEAPPSDAAGIGESSLRVLAVEDNATNRQVLRLMLQSIGIEPVFAEDGMEAVKTVQTQPFDIIFMDVNMPRMDGVAATRAIRRLASPAALTPIHMLTANVFEEDRKRYLEAGADGVIAKPIVVADICAALQAATGAPEPSEERIA